MSEPTSQFDACESLEDYLTSELSPARRSEFECHLESCEACRAAVDDWHVLSRTLRNATRQLETPSPALLERIDSQVTARPPRDGRESHKQVQKWRVAALVGASLLAAAPFGVLLRPAPRRDEIAQSPRPRTPIPVPALAKPAPRPKLEFPNDVIGVPIDIGEPDVTVVWVYPTGPIGNRTN